MEIEVGKAYRTRDGEKVVIDSDGGSGILEFMGKIGDEWNSWNNKGEWTSYESDHDLISEWIEPVKLKIETGKFYQYRNGIRAFVYWANSCGDVVSVEITKNGDAETESCWCHAEDGSVLGFNSHEFDIIGPWIDPPKPLEHWSNIYSEHNGRFRVSGRHDTKESAIKASNNAGVASLPVRTSKFVEVLE